MYEYVVGQTVPEFTGRPDGTIFDMDSDGAYLLMLYNAPTDQEVHDARDGTATFKWFELDGVAFLLARFGNQQWVDCPYHPAMSAEPSTIPLVQEGQGLALMILLADTATGIVRSIRLIGLPTAMSRRISHYAATAPTVSRAAYDAAIARVYAKWSTEQMVARAL